MSEERIAAALALRRDVSARMFGAEADRLARACHAIAERFARGGRLLALALTPAGRTDAAHVAVEFVHPVIVGKRALPALELTDVAQVDLLAEPDDIVVAFGEGLANAARRPRGSAAVSRSLSTPRTPNGCSILQQQTRRYARSL